MFSKRLLSVLGVLLAFALVAAACGGDDSSDTTAAPSDGDTTTTTAAPSDGDGDETTTTTAAPPGEPFKMGILLVGPEFDQGYSQAHFEGAEWAMEQIGGELVSLDFINPADNPGLTPEGVARDMIDQGAQLVVFNSDDMREGAFLAAEQNPDVPMIWVSGDSAWADGKAFREDLTNLGNVWGEMIFGKMIAGCAAGLTTQNGHLGYL